MQKNNERLFREQEQREQRRRALAAAAGDLEYGLNTRTAAQPSSYLGGIADDAHLGTSRRVDEPQVPAPAYVKYSKCLFAPSSKLNIKGRNTVPTPTLSQPYPPVSPAVSGLPSSHPPSVIPPVQIGLAHGSSSEVERSETDVPPSYSTLVPGR
jgi:hypothetical protein